MTPLAAFLAVAAVIAACAASPVQAGIGAAILVLGLAVQMAAQAGMWLPEPEEPPIGRPAEVYHDDL